MNPTSSRPVFVLLRSCARGGLCAAACLFAAGASMAQWQWIDANGHKVYSDRAPPAGTVSQRSIIKSPTGAPPPQAVPPAALVAASPAVATAASSASAAAQDQAARDAAEAQRVAKIRQDNCDRAKRSLATLDSGMRIATVDDKGQRQVMDDAAREAEKARVQGIIASDCGPQAAAQ